MQRRPIYFAFGIALMLAAGAGYYFIQSSRVANTASTDPLPATEENREQLPDPSILVIDRAALMRSSNVGQDVNRQLQEYADKAKSDLDRENRALQSEVKQFQQKIATLASDAKQKKIASFGTRRAALQEFARQKDEQLKTILAKARGAIEQSLRPILQQVTQEHGANLVLDKRAVPFGNDSAFDITDEVIKRLNQKMPSYKIVVPAPNK